MLNYITSGESHGKCLISVLEGVPSGIPVDIEKINFDLLQRQKGYGRGGRMRIEADKVEIPSGIVKGKTTGAPIAFIIPNRDFKINEMPDILRPRPGHADLTGALKYNQSIRAVLERASARETALRVAVGSFCKQILRPFSIDVIGYVTQIGRVKGKKELKFEDLKETVFSSSLRVSDLSLEEKMTAEIDYAASNGDTVGGEVEIIVKDVPPGLGSYAHYAKKLDAKIAFALMSVQAVKSVEFGLGKDYARTFGFNAHDPIYYSKRRGYYRKTNNAGGIEGGMTNGSDIIVRAVMKPIATLRKPLPSVNMATKVKEDAEFERSDTCAVTACSVVAEAVVAFEIADAFLEKFGGDSMREINRNFRGYLEQIRE